MPVAPKRSCPQPYCPHLQPCPVHRCVYDRARGSAQARGYDAAWAAYSRAWLQRHRWCGERADGQLYAAQSRCVQRGLRTPATVTDHIVALRDGGARLDPSNHQSVCRSCNAAKAVQR